jgi:hypothetical protein
MNDSKNERGETANSVRERLAPWLVNMALLLMALEQGGSLYERLVVDPAWTTNLAIIQPDSGGMNRKAFWIPLHGALTLMLPIALWACWRSRAARRWLLAALGVYLAMRAWTFAYFIPLASQFEVAEEFSDAIAKDAQTWVLLSSLRTPMILAVAAALWAAARRLDQEPQAVGKRRTV